MNSLGKKTPPTLGLNLIFETASVQSLRVLTPGVSGRLESPGCKAQSLRPSLTKTASSNNWTCVIAREACFKVGNGLGQTSWHCVVLSTHDCKIPNKTKKRTNHEYIPIETRDVQ
jgi:hypothetical protein